MRHGQSFPEDFFKQLKRKRIKSKTQSLARKIPKLFDYFEDDIFSEALAEYKPSKPQQLLIRLSNKIHSLGAATEDQRVSIIPAGYVYLAQFAVHDMINSAPLENLIELEAGSNGNLATTGLDLGSLYGMSPNGTEQFFEFDETTGVRGRFRIGQLNRSKSKKCYRPGPREDIPRMKFHPVAGCPAGSNLFEPLIADVRNADNLILSQLTVLFMKLHNKIFDEINSSKKRPSRNKSFQIARALTTQIYVRILEDDLLARICDNDVWQQYQSYQDLSELPGIDSNGVYQVPVECVFAGLRFGHAMVRTNYHFNEEHGGAPAKRASLKKLLDFSGLSSNAGEVLPTDRTWQIDWSRFFPDPDAPLPSDLGATPFVNFANKITPAISRTLRNHAAIQIKPKDDQRYKGVEFGLAFRTLAKGVVFGLPTGQALHRELANATGSNVAAVATSDISTLLSASGNDETPAGPNWLLDAQDISFLSRNTPLFLYVLAEAAVSKHKGNRLGFVGSHLVAHAFRGAVLSWEQTHQRLNISDYLENAPETAPQLVEFVKNPRSP